MGNKLAQLYNNNFYVTIWRGQVSTLGYLILIDIVYCFQDKNITKHLTSIENPTKNGPWIETWIKLNLKLTEEDNNKTLMILFKETIIIKTVINTTLCRGMSVFIYISERVHWVFSESYISSFCHSIYLILYRLVTYFT